MTTRTYVLVATERFFNTILYATPDAAELRSYLRSQGVTSKHNQYVIVCDGAKCQEEGAPTAWEFLNGQVDPH